VPWVLGLTAPAVVAVVWGTYLSPRRRIDLPKPVRFTLELAVFGIAALALLATGQDALAIVLAAAAVVSGALNYAWGDEPPKARPAG
jgi:EamA domain-containing membrane protein RarD